MWCSWPNALLCGCFSTPVTYKQTSVIQLIRVIRMITVRIKRLRQLCYASLLFLRPHWGEKKREAFAAEKPSQRANCTSGGLMQIPQLHQTFVKFIISTADRLLWTRRVHDDRCSMVKQPVVAPKMHRPAPQASSKASPQRHFFQLQLIPRTQVHHFSFITKSP